MDLVHALSQLLNECRWRSKQLIQRCLVDRALDFLIVVHLFLVHLLLWNEHFTVCVDGNFKMNYLLLSSTDISTSSSHSLVTKHSHSTALVFRYEQFLQVGWLYRALILLGLTLCLPSASVSSVFMVLYIDISFFCLHPSLYLLVSWAWWDCPLTWLTNHHPSVLWHCWLGHLTRKIVSEMVGGSAYDRHFLG